MRSEIPQENPEDGLVVAPETEGLDLGSAPVLKELLLTAMSAGGSVCFDASAVTQVDTANLQLLCAAARDLQRRGDRFSVRAPSPAFVRAVERLGLGSVLGLTSATEG